MKLRSFGVIFDVDGTLLNSMPLAYAGVCNIFTMSGKPNPTFQEYFSKFRVPYMDFYRQRGIEVSEQQCWDWYHDVAKHGDAEMFDDVASTLAKLHEWKVSMAIVSAQRQVVIDGHCNKNAFNKYFQHVIGNTLGKVEAIKGIVHCFCLLPGNIFYVGDFVSDVEEALAAGVIAVGITRGQETRECLLDAGAHYCIEHLTELLNILQQRSQLE